ncbi:MAG: hypothetical protein AB7O52_13175 [Planctomycetota bacterium]
MSTSRKLVAVLLTLAALGVLRDVGWAQTDGGDVVGAVLARDFADLDALSASLSSPELRTQIDPLLAAGGVVDQLSFNLFFESPAGDKIYFGSLSVGALTWSWVHFQPSGSGLAATTYVRANASAAVHVKGHVVPDSVGLEMIATVLSHPPAAIAQPCAAEMSMRKLTGLRVVRSSGTQRVTHYRLELFFGGEGTPKVVIGADCTAGVLSNVAVE